MRQQTRFRWTERWRRARRVLAAWQQRDPAPWVVTLVGIGLGFGLFVLGLLLLRVLPLLADVAHLLR